MWEFKRRSCHMSEKGSNGEKEGTRYHAHETMYFGTFFRRMHSCRDWKLGSFMCYNRGIYVLRFVGLS